jgi:hypothetical protein
VAGTASAQALPPCLPLGCPLAPPTAHPGPHPVTAPYPCTLPLQEPAGPAAQRCLSVTARELRAAGGGAFIFQLLLSLGINPQPSRGEWPRNSAAKRVGQAEKDQGTAVRRMEGKLAGGQPGRKHGRGGAESETRGGSGKAWGGCSSSRMAPPNSYFFGRCIFEVVCSGKEAMGRRVGQQGHETRRDGTEK